jgi:hypothetical protein
MSLDSYKIEEVRHRWFVRAFLILVHKDGSILHGPFPHAEVIGAMVELQIGGAFFINITSWGQPLLFHKKGGAFQMSLVVCFSS